MKIINFQFENQPKNWWINDKYPTSYILIHLVSQSVTGLEKGVLCSRELSAVGRMVTD
jgi:hypothetical protein